MSRFSLSLGASAGALALALGVNAASAQQTLPTIDIGSARRAASSGKPVRSVSQSGAPAGGQQSDNAGQHSTAATPGGPNDPKAYAKQDATAATKTDTPIMQTPANVVVVPQQVLRDQQVVRLDEAVQNVSNVYPISVGGLQSGYLIRGFENYNYFLDGVRVQNQITPISEEMADIQQIEVLKGPASILYGRVEPGGIVALTTKAPLDTPYHSIQQQFGSYQFYRTTIDSTGPVTEDKSVLYRFNLAYENAHSFREFVQNRRIFIAPRIHWAPTQDTFFNLYLRYTNGMGPLDFGTPNLVDANTFKPLAIAPAPRWRNYGEPGSQVNNYNLRAGFNWTHSFSRDWSFTHRFDAYYVKELGNVLVPFDVEVPCPDTCTIGRLINNPNATAMNYFTSAELKGKVDTFGISHSLLFGWDFFKQSGYQTRSFAFNIPGIDFFFPIHTGLPTYALINPDTRYTINLGQSWNGFYVQDQMALPYNFYLLAGFRYDIAKTFSRQQFILPAPDIVSATSNQDAGTPRVGLLWQPFPQLSLFGDYVEGFGAQTLLNGDGSPNTNLLAPQRSKQWEAGAKLSLLDDRLLTTVSWFDIVKTNIPTPNPDPELAAQGKLVSTGAVRNQGVDLDISGQLTPELKVIGSFAYIDSKIVKDNTENVGNRFYGVPRFGGSLWAVYEPQIDILRGLSLGAGFLARSNTELDNANSFTVPGYTTVNLMARYGLTVNKSKVSFQLNVNNLTDTVYYTTFGGGGFVYPGTPRTILGSIKVEF